jgi:hypothetical protein
MVDVHEFGDWKLHANEFWALTCGTKYTPVESTDVAPHRPGPNV